MWPYNAISCHVHKKFILYCVDDIVYLSTHTFNNVVFVLLFVNSLYFKIPLNNHTHYTCKIGLLLL